MVGERGEGQSKIKVEGYVLCGRSCLVGGSSAVLIDGIGNRFVLGNTDMK